MPARIDIGRNSSYRQGTDSDTRGLEQSEEVMLTSEVSDEALESAAGTGAKKRGSTPFSTALLWISAPAPKQEIYSASHGWNPCQIGDRL